MKVEWKGTEKLNAKLKQIVQNYPREKNKFLKQTAEKLLTRTKKLTPADTGKLRGSWQRSEPEGNSIDVYNNTEYAPYVEFGHRIVAFGKDTGKVKEGVFMLRDAVDESSDNFVKDANEILARLFK